MNTRERKSRVGKRKTRRTVLKCEKLGDRVLMAADVMNDLIESKETPAEISTQAPAKSQSADSTKDDASAKGNSSSTKTPVTKSSEPIWVTMKAESLGEADKATEGDDGAKEMSKGERSGPKAKNVEPMLQTKEQLLFEGESIEVQQRIEDHLAHSKLEEIEGLERMESSLLDDLMAERSAETERYGKIERESLMDEIAKPTSLLHEITGGVAGSTDAKAMTEAVLGYGMAGCSSEWPEGLEFWSGNQMFGDTWVSMEWLLEDKSDGISEFPPGTTNSVEFNLLGSAFKFHIRTTNDGYELNLWIDFSKPTGDHPSRTYPDGSEMWLTLKEVHPEPEDDDDCPAPDGTRSETSLPTQLVREAMVKFNAQYRQQPWLGISGQPVPDSDGGTPLDFDAAAQVFGQLGRQNWNPMIVQPGPEGDMESNQAGAKEAPRNVGAMKMAMAGQPNPEDPEWGTSEGGKGGPSGAVTFNQQPVTTQRAAVGGAEHDLKVEQQED